MAEASTGERLRFYTVRSWAGDCLAPKTEGAKSATGRRYKTSIDAFLSFVGDKADMKLEALTKSDLRAFRDSLRKGQSAAAVNFYMADVAGTFHSLRHSLTSQLANLNVPEEIRRRITAHKSADVHQGYTTMEGDARAGVGEAAIGLIRTISTRGGPANQSARPQSVGGLLKVIGLGGSTSRKKSNPPGALPRRGVAGVVGGTTTPPIQNRKQIEQVFKPIQPVDLEARLPNSS